MPFPIILIGGGLALASTISLLRGRKSIQHSGKDVEVIDAKALTSKASKSLVEQHEHDMQQRKVDADQNLKISLLAMGTSGIASLAYPPLLFVSVPLTLYGSTSIFRDTFVGWKEKRQLRASAVDSIAIIGTLATHYYFAATFINALYFLGQKALLKTEDHSNQKLLKLFDNRPQSVWLWREGVEIEVPFEQVEAGNVVVVHAGEAIPFDGEIVQGVATIDQHMLTGESQPQEKRLGDEVFASTLLVGGKFHLRVEKAGKDTVAAQIGEILQNTVDFKSTIEARGTKVANRLTLPTLVLSGVALGTMGPVSATAITNCNFSDIVRITVPLGVLNHLKLAAEQGILVKDGRALELLGQVDTVVFDKTGTLTQETPCVGQIYTCKGFQEDVVLALAASVEHRQTHPVARAIQQAAEQKNLELEAMEQVHYELGYGIKASIQGQNILLGSQRFMAKEGINLPEEGAWLLSDINEEHSKVYLAIEGQLAGVIELQIALRPEVPEMIRTLRQRGLKLCILSGDHEQPTRKLAESLGIQQYFAETLPEDKAKHIEAMQATGSKVCFIGDGINDAVAMKKAQVAISIAGATTVATDTANIVLMDKSLKQLDTLFTFSKGFERNMKSGLAWALLPGIAGIGGVFLFHMRIYGAMGLYALSLGAGGVNAALPLLRGKGE
ncbi:MAG: Lead, cadmium, zinc and mercury transporting ATPase (EC (EC; Copper-translocating P-type ATPase (EC [uncultured Thiotrichaceae bacterium]|uniref:P-type Zn(2+) transporter n=1 Tax=uncultured Thiotrichaceae bacterium TaxID=298394 RepID=A0A6S6U3P2_9GAMM|nr:MAG: Lead, cadmium, zinc and mercury transporting ATPase (EC (EC; Copper-translocating P-type ATPase (EC [uncultured Thiotrichaceae bacterium]